jgi:hypothetical protein
MLYEEMKKNIKEKIKKMDELLESEKLEDEKL